MKKDMLRGLENTFQLLHSCLIICKNHWHVWLQALLCKSLCGSLKITHVDVIRWSFFVAINIHVILLLWTMTYWGLSW